MDDRKFKNVKVVSASGEEYSFSDIRDMQINVEKGILDLHLADGNFVLFLDSLSYFEVGLASNNNQAIRFRQCDLVLSAPGGRSGSSEVALSEKLTVNDVINYDWKADQGLFLVFSKLSTLGVHLDHMVSFRCFI